MRGKMNTFQGWSGKRSNVGAKPFLMPTGYSELRLTLTAGTPVTTSDVTAASSISLTAHNGNRIALPTAWGEWGLFRLPQTSAGIYQISQSFLANSAWALVSGTVYDVFAYLDHNGWVNIERGPAWSSSIARAATGAIGLLDGAEVLAGDPTRLWIGTLGSSGTNTVDDSSAKRYLWNRYNRAARFFKAVETTDSWTYTTDDWRESNGGSTEGTSRVGLIIGKAVEIVEAWAIATNSTTLSGGITAPSGIGIDSSTASSSQIVTGSAVGQGAQPSHSYYAGYPGIGYHTVSWLERSVASGTTTWYGDAGLSYFQAGMYGHFWA